MRLTYANVVSTLALFLVLTGGVAYAAHRYLTRKSVGAAQLKANAVTTAKIRANSVTTRKIKRIAVSTEKLKEGAVTMEKIADGAVDSDKIDLADVPFARVTARLRTGGNLPLEAEPQVYPLAGSTYTQAPDELDSFAGEVKVTIPAKCAGTRAVDAFVVVDAQKPTEATEAETFASGSFEDDVSGAETRTIELQPGPSQVLFEPGAPAARTIDLVASASCPGGGGGVALPSGAVDVIANR
jgi:hypothetical protein